ncbi:MAG: hypothetical protein IPJ20_06475 [Flammeovirgaceae bacterium]|nr:hypothetical protein [Flammeovirgaceae bacterium]
MNYFKGAVTQFNDKKDDIYRLYTDNALLEAGYIKSTIKFLDDFMKLLIIQKLIRIPIPLPLGWNG